MKFVAPLVLCIAAAVAAENDDSKLASEVRALSEVNEFALDVEVFGKRPHGEVLLARILKREDKIRPLIEVFNRGTPEAKAYALAAFHHLAPELFERCRKDLVGSYNPKVRVLRGGVIGEGTFLELVIRIEHGEFDACVRAHAKKG